MILNLFLKMIWLNSAPFEGGRSSSRSSNLEFVVAEIVIQLGKVPWLKWIIFILNGGLPRFIVHFGPLSSAPLSRNHLCKQLNPRDLTLYFDGAFKRWPPVRSSKKLRNSSLNLFLEGFWKRFLFIKTVTPPSNAERLWQVYCHFG